MDDFFNEMDRYYLLSQETKNELIKISKTRKYKKNEFILQSGDLALNYYFVRKGLLGYYTLDKEGNIIYKIFFDEKSFAASTVAIVEEKESEFNIIALEDVELIVYSAQKFRELLHKYHDLALFHINYLEKNWVVKKEHLEIDLKWETAKKRYLELMQKEKLFNRLKQHHIASYLGITPTQLSRIRKEINL